MSGSADGVIDGLVTLDLDRARRRGAPEAVLCDGKTVAQVGAIAREYARLIAAHDARPVPDVGTAPDERAAPPGATAPAGETTRDEGPAPLGPILFTRADEERAHAVLEALPDAHHDPEARLLAWPPQPPAPSGGLVIVACAGTSDLPVAREALLTAQHLGRPARLIADIGIAGLHRLQARLPELREAACVIVAAGMDGALPTVVAGQVAAPVVALPTSVGYGVAAGGVTAALTMLSGCAPGIGVVNIDNGYGAGHLAAQIARWAPGPGTDPGTDPRG
ncbi:nickel pincer cofactor biosynthesis protein LarB [Brachybacterium kimchii]|uniref:Nickel pincer cofactor biosynthesis protein LarB n=1 Tax=Brachybacterium kimchii TaxID=2942909 RepID=A0ABY4N5K3_9MICO|nr:nickel pincer cofactor biosynthesis protein LarB [Brachybacterium kimchii]UQN28670.1 nickel pincer cofactor biosynthesis protein LarB [Brachybacterium kimchii]